LKRSKINNIDLDLNYFLEEKPMKMFNETFNKNLLKNSSSIFNKTNLILSKNEKNQNQNSRKVFTAKPEIKKNNLKKFNEIYNKKKYDFEKTSQTKFKNQSGQKDFRSKDFLKVTSLNEKCNFPMEKNIYNDHKFYNGKFLCQNKNNINKNLNLDIDYIMKKRGSNSMSLSELNITKSKDSPIRIKRPKIFNNELMSSIKNPQIKCELQKEKIKYVINTNNKKIAMYPIIKASKPLPKKMILTKKIYQKPEIQLKVNDNDNDNEKEKEREYNDYMSFQIINYEENGSNNITPAKIEKNFEETTNNKGTEYKMFDKYNIKFATYEDKTNEDKTYEDKNV